jgi:ferredoxin
MVQMAKYFLGFTMNESCGKCVPCREGIRRMNEVLVDITEGRGQPGDIELLQRMGETIAESSLCGLGATAPRPVLSTLKYFPEEYTEHIEAKYCRALMCRSLVRYEIVPSRCRGCGLCALSCSSQAIQGSKELPHKIDQALCTKCGACIDACPSDARAVIKTSGLTTPKASKVTPAGLFEVSR